VYEASRIVVATARRKLSRGQIPQAAVGPVLVELIHGRKEADLSTLLCPVEDEVVGPNMILVFRSMPKAAIA
jgi:hypothetical protein